MIALFAPPYLREGLRQALATHPGAAELMATGELQVVSRLEHCLDATLSRAVVITAPPERVRAWASGAPGGDAGDGLLTASNALAGAAVAASAASALQVDEAALHADLPRELRRIAGFLLEEEAHWQTPARIEGLPSSACIAAELAALDIYRQLPLATGATVRWSAELFRSVEPAFPDAIDITGPPRNLAFGPYLCLPPGLWEAGLEFELCADAAQYDYQIDFGVPDDLAECVVRPAGAGLQIATLRHAISSPAPAEVRLWLGRAAFHGRLQLHGATLTYLAPQTPR